MLHIVGAQYATVMEDQHRQKAISISNTKKTEIVFAIKLILKW